MSVNFEERKREKWNGMGIMEVWLVGVSMSEVLWSWENSEKLWPFSRGDLIFLTQREAHVTLLPLSWTQVIYFHIWGWICQSPASLTLLFQPLSWIPRCPGTHPRTVGRKCWRVTLQCALPGWLGVLGECRGQWKRLFMILSSFPIQIEGISSISHKSRLCGSASKMLVVPKWPRKLTR